LSLDCQPKIRSAFVYCPLNRLGAAILADKNRGEPDWALFTSVSGEDTARPHAAAPPMQREAD
jgi:hypothetical protein